MNNAKDTIYRRRSWRSYCDRPLDDETKSRIEEMISSLKPLTDIRTRIVFVTREEVNSPFSWLPHDILAVFSEEKEGYLTNVGFLLQQLELELQAMGLGTCWLGMGKPKKDTLSEYSDGLGYVIMMSVGYPIGEYRASIGEFKRRRMDEISDVEDERLLPARLAPSAVNSQPWYFSHEGEYVHLHLVQKGLMKVKPIVYFNRIDVGIALAHIYVSYPDTFSYVRLPDAPYKKGAIEYVGSIKI